MDKNKYQGLYTAYQNIYESKTREVPTVQQESYHDEFQQYLSDNYDDLYGQFVDMINEKNHEDEVNKAATKELSKMGWKGKNDDPVVTKLKRYDGQKKYKTANQIRGGKTGINFKERGGVNHFRSGHATGSAGDDIGKKKKK